MPGLPASAFDRLDLPPFLRIPWTELRTAGQVLEPLLLNGAVWVSVIAVLLVADFQRDGRVNRLIRHLREQWEYEDIEHAAPPEADPAWKGRVIPEPHLHSHRDDPTLLPTSSAESRSHEPMKREYLTCYDPSTAYHLATLPLLSIDEIYTNISRTAAAQKRWARSTFRERRKVMRTVKRWFLRDMDKIVDVACRDTGKTRPDAVFGEILTTLAKLDWLISHGERTLSPSRRPVPLLLAHKSTSVHYTPLGLTMACVSWNYSAHNLLSPILASLSAGNTCVVKVSEQVAWSSMWFIEGMRRCLRACGWSGHEVDIVVCLPETAARVIRHSDVKHLTFIGSEEVGKKVAQAAGEMMIPACMELGGKDPAIILPGTDIERIMSILMRGVFQSAGQNCIGIELFLVPSDLYDRFIALFEARIRTLRLGVDVGSLISHAPIPKLLDLLSDATARGARILVGGRACTNPLHPHGAYFEPTLIVDVTPDMLIAQTECFAPIATVMKYTSIREAVGWVNSGRFGLGAGVYGDDVTLAHEVANQLQAGMVSINDFGVFYLNQAAPFGGVKASGYGRFGGEEGLRSLCSAKNITSDRSWLRTSIPRAVDYPFKRPEDGGRADEFLNGLVRYGFGGWWEKVGGIWDVIKYAKG